MLQRLMPWLLQSEKKPPKGFEKFFKKKEETSATKGKLSALGQFSIQMPCSKAYIIA
jgi:hypothetical protein